MRRVLVPMAIATLLAPAAPRAFEWSGRVGVLYGRDDQWSPAGARLTDPRLDLDLALDAAGYFYRPGAVAYQGGVLYRRLATSLGGPSRVDDDLSYRLRSAIFGDPASPFRLDLAADRVDSGSTSSGDQIGDFKSRIYGATATIAVPDRPAVQLGYAYDELTRDVLTLGPSSRTLQTVTANAQHGATGYSYDARYQGHLSDGTFAADNYDDHQVDVNAAANLSDPFSLQFSEHYFLRLPRLDSTFNPRQETNSAFASLRYGYGNAPTVTRLNYSYGHAVQTAPGVADVERTSNRMELSVLRNLTSTWSLQGDVSGTFADDRLGVELQRNSGQDLSGTVRWRSATDTDSLELHAGPSVGLLEPSGADTQLAWGGRGGVALARTWGEYRTTLSYDLSYANGLAAEQGWSFRQQGLAGADRVLGMGVLRVQVTLSSDRHESPLFGAGASRSVSGRLEYRWGTSTLSAQASQSDGIAGTVTGVNGDGLFLPAPYNTHVRTASLVGSTLFFRRIAVTGRALYSSTDLPDRPALDEGELYGSVDLVYAALRIGVEDRYVVSETPAGTGRTNQVLLRLYRTFGSR
ncbi:hypothetical protein [Anaeromyxobacter oryzae]|uniref:PEP-CTERM system associated protein n=1 Tax=Anaeromyxobacter oryzae TaxID=2918170 RepID=A0ABM7X4W1_9BACT|nr:hypothetical protein [Anaeromyxobacter oryzae]BDG06843.1 hypothetical protein AMOR_58390 [Anaeromyxobacter oryzae]